MAEEVKKTKTVAKVEGDKKPEEETVSKKEFDELVAQYEKVARAFNKAINMLANNYAQNIVKELMGE